MAGHVADMPAAYAAADLVVVPCDAPPADTAGVVAQAQTMARPVITTSVGPLPGMMGAPPRTPSSYAPAGRVPPARLPNLPQAIFTVLALDPPTYAPTPPALGSWPKATFSPQRTAAATLESMRRSW